jgi:small GTP-binding protein
MSELTTKKLVVCGDGTVGKTCLLTRYTVGTFNDGYVPTVFDNQNKTVTVDDKSVELEIVDTGMFTTTPSKPIEKERSSM